MKRYTIIVQDKDSRDMYEINTDDENEYKHITALTVIQVIDNEKDKR